MIVLTGGIQFLTGTAINTRSTAISVTDMHMNMEIRVMKDILMRVDMVIRRSIMSTGMKVISTNTVNRTRSETSERSAAAG